MKSGNKPILIFGVPVVLLSLALLFLPSTGGFFKQQLTMLLRLPRYQQFWLAGSAAHSDLAKGDFEHEMDEVKETVSSHASEMKVRLGVAGYATDSMLLRHLNNMAVEDRRNPMPCANLLRFFTLQTVHLDRPEVNISSPERRAPRQLEQRLDNQAPQNLSIDSFIDAAKTGEAAEPKNAYFPMMLAVGLYDRHKDKEALEAIRRASVMPIWNDYATDETLGVWRIDELTHGRQTGIVKTLQSKLLLLPHLVSLRGLARMAQYKAKELERAGKPAEGLNLRKEMALCGSLMRREANYEVANLAGCAIIETALSDFDFDLNAGIKKSKTSPPALDSCIDWLKRNHLEAEIPWVEREASAIQNARRIIAIGSWKAAGNSADLKRLNLCWIVNMALLNSVLWLSLVCGTALYVNSQKKKTKEGELFLILTGLAAATIVTFRTSRWVEIQALFIQVIDSFAVSKSTLTAADLSRNVSTSHAFTYLSSWILPVAIVAILAAFPSAKYPTLPVKLAKRLSSYGLQLCLALFCAYAVSLFWTGYQEDRFQSAASKKLQHSGRFYAKQLGEEWR